MNSLTNKPNVLLEKTYQLSVQSISIYKQLLDNHEYVLSKQFFRSVTAVGAMAEEAQAAHSKRDFIAKLEIGLKELRESRYWARLLVQGQFVRGSELQLVQTLQSECEALLTSILKTLKS